MRRLAWPLPLSCVAALAAFVVGGCADPGTTGGGGGPADQSVVIDMAGCGGDSDCATGLHCDPQSHACVECVMDGDCASGKVCSTQKTCVSGCSAGHSCGDGGLCEQD